MKTLQLNADVNMFSRNKGLISEREQEVLANSCIAIAGAGGDGGLLAERLTRFGIGKLILADPENFEPSNINRQFAANQMSLGQNKAEAVAAELTLINPDLNLAVYKEGLTAENVRQIVSEADIIIDEIEYSLPAISVMLHKEARRLGKHVFMGANIGWGATVFCFSPSGMTFEEYFEYDEERKTINPLKYLHERPDHLSEDDIAEILSGNIPMPALSSSVSLVAAVMATEIMLFMTGKRSPLLVPQFLSIDLYKRSIDFPNS